MLSVTVHTDNEAASLSVQRGPLNAYFIIRMYKGVLVICIYKKALLSVQVKDVRIDIVRITNEVHVPITRP